MALQSSTMLVLVLWCASSKAPCGSTTPVCAAVLLGLPPVGLGQPTPRTLAAVALAGAAVLLGSGSTGCAIRSGFSALCCGRICCTQSCCLQPHTGGWCTCGITCETNRTRGINPCLASTRELGL